MYITIVNVVDNDDDNEFVDIEYWPISLNRNY